MRILLAFLLLVVITNTYAEERPNVLMICIDDLNDWTGFLGGHPDVRTPHMDKLAARGRVFSNAHCAVPVCSSSRISVMSGLAATMHGSYEIGPNYTDIPALEKAPTIHRYFKDNGYITLTGGKVLHHGFGGRLAEDIDQSLGRFPHNRPKKTLNLPKGWSRAWDWGEYPDTNKEMSDYKLALSAVEALKGNYNKPFFMSVGFFRPHVPLYVPPEWYDLYDINKITLPDNPLADLDDVPEYFQTINDYALAPTHREVVENDKQRALTQAYLASISFVDHCVGMVMQGLAEGPHADNTIVVLWSDHGFHLGEKQHWAKRTLWEESTKVPLIFAGPGIKPGKHCKEAVSLLDIYPTLIDLCDLSDKSQLQGTTLAFQLADPAAQRVAPAITSSYFGNHSIRTRDWRLIVYDDGAEELYDHRNDPDEFNNLASKPEHQKVRDELRGWLPQKAAPEFKKKSERRIKSRK